MIDQIEVVRLNRLDGTGSLKAFCDISLFDALVIKGLRIVNGKNGLFVGMPREKAKDGKWYNTVNPLNGEVKKAIESVVLQAYAE